MLSILHFHYGLQPLHVIMTFFNYLCFLKEECTGNERFCNYFVLFSMFGASSQIVMLKLLIEM